MGADARAPVAARVSAARPQACTRLVLEAGGNVAVAGRRGFLGSSMRDNLVVRLDGRTGAFLWLSAPTFPRAAPAGGTR